MSTSLLTRLTGILAATIALVWVPATAATSLTFVAAPGETCSLNGYGNRVEAAIQDGCSYGAAGGHTPNIRVTYLPELRTYDTGYGDLDQVLYAPSGVILITLKADPGFKVRLRSFQLAGWRYANYRIRSVRVTDDRGRVLFSRSKALIQGSGPNHTNFRLSGMAARLLKIRVDARNLGAEGDNIGIDNIVFSQR